jgi:hypothetical protein
MVNRSKIFMIIAPKEGGTLMYQMKCISFNKYRKNEII